MHGTLRRLAAALAAGLALTGVAIQQRAGAAGDADPASCEALVELDLADVTEISAEMVTSGTAAEQTDLPPFCQVVLTVEPSIGIEVWLPTDNYNGRFQAVGGGGYAGVIRYERDGLADALRGGYATASTDTGHAGSQDATGRTRDGSFALGEDGELQLGLIEDFASRSLVEMTTKAQQLVAAFTAARRNTATSTAAPRVAVRG